MTAGELRRQLSKFDDNTEVEIELMVMENCNCDDYCLCGYEPKRREAGRIELTDRNEYGRPMKNHKLIIKAE